MSKVFHCLKSVPIRPFSSPYSPAFGLNKEIYEVNVVQMRQKYGPEKHQIRTLFIQCLGLIKKNHRASCS